MQVSARSAGERKVTGFYPDLELPVLPACKVRSRGAVQAWHALGKYTAALMQGSAASAAAAAPPHRRHAATALFGSLVRPQKAPASSRLARGLPAKQSPKKKISRLPSPSPPPPAARRQA